MSNITEGFLDSLIEDVEAALEWKDYAELSGDFHYGERVAILKPIIVDLLNEVNVKMEE